MEKKKEEFDETRGEREKLKIMIYKSIVCIFTSLL